MNIIEHDLDKEDTLLVEPGFTYLISGKKGTINLPDCDKISIVKMIFLDEGNFYVNCLFKDIGLGSYVSKNTLFETEGGFCDKQPSFIYVPSRQRWLIISKGIVTFITEAEQACKV